MDNEGVYKSAVYCRVETLAHLAGVKLKEFYFNPKSCVHSFKIGREKLKEIFGNDIVLPEVTTPILTYGHMACLGANVIFPENTEPCVKPMFSNIDDGISALKKEEDFSSCSLAKHFINMYKILKEEFPRDAVTLGGFGYDGPVTTAVLLRGQDFFMDIMDEPKKAAEFINLVTESIIRFVHFIKDIEGKPQIDECINLNDDFASLLSPNLWDEMVIPYWEKYYYRLTSGKRTIHVENLGPEHLEHLNKLNICFYDPSMSPRLTPSVIRKKIQIPFSWRLHGVEYSGMSLENISEWVKNTADTGAATILTVVENYMCHGEYPGKVRMFSDTLIKMFSDQAVK